MALQKKDIHDEFLRIIEEDDHEQILKYIFDYFNTSECIALLEHIKEEKAIDGMDNANDYEKD